MVASNERKLTDASGQEFSLLIMVEVPAALRGEGSRNWNLA